MTAEADGELDNREKWSYALRIYQDALASSPRSRRALRGMAECYRQLEDYEAAIHTLTELIGLDPKHEELPELYVERSQNYLDYGYADDAVRDLTKALHHEPEDGELLRKRAEAALEDRNIPLALADINQSLQKEDTVARLLTQAEILTYLRLFDRAQEVCQKAITLEPDNYQGPLELGRILRSAGNATAALDHWESMLEKFPDQQHLVLDEMISCQRTQDDMEAVIRLLKQKLAIAPQNSNDLLQLAFCYQDIGDTTRARNTLEEAIRIGEENGYEEGWENMRVAHLYTRAEMWEEAADEYALALQRLDPMFSYVYLSAAEAMNKCGRYQQALAACDQALQADTSYTDVKLQAERAVSLMGLGHTDEALQVVNQLMDTDFTPAWLLAQRAEIHAAMGNPELAIADLHQAVSWQLPAVQQREALITLLEDANEEKQALIEQWELIKLLQDYNGAITLEEAAHAEGSASPELGPYVDYY